MGEYIFLKNGSMDQAWFLLLKISSNCKYVFSFDELFNCFLINNLLIFCVQVVHMLYGDAYVYYSFNLYSDSLYGLVLRNYSILEEPTNQIIISACVVWN